MKVKTKISYMQDTSLNVLVTVEMTAGFTSAILVMRQDQWSKTFLRVATREDLTTLKTDAHDWQFRVSTCNIDTPDVEAARKVAADVRAKARALVRELNGEVRSFNAQARALRASRAAEHKGAAS